jgi:hypothetical protein
MMPLESPVSHATIWSSIILLDPSVMLLELSIKLQENFYTTRVTHYNGIARFKKVNSCLNNNIYSYLETSGSKSYNLH